VIELVRTLSGRSYWHMIAIMAVGMAASKAARI
jgi:hypothetical protein